MERVPRTGASVYRQPNPPPDLLPVMASGSAEPVPPAGLSPAVPTLLRPHVPTVHTAHMALFTQTMCNPPVAGLHQSKFNFGLNVIFFSYQPQDRTIFVEIGE